MKMDDNEKAPQGVSAPNGATEGTRPREDGIAPQGKGQSGVGADGEAQRLLNTMQEGDVEEVPLAQAFTEDHAQLAISVATGPGHEVWLVTSDRKVHKVYPNAPAEAGKKAPVEAVKLMTAGNPSEYCKLVKPRWRKGSLDAFLHGENLGDPTATYLRMKAALDKLIEFADPFASDIVCCWVIGTYLYRLFDAFPYLGVLGPKGSGKTKLAQIIEALAFNPIHTDSITTAQLFRLVAVTGGTLILDEQETLNVKLSDHDRLALLRGGYKRGGNALRSREGPTGYTTEKFDTYGPKVIINTSGLDDMLADRCLP
ncbi:MAG: hypothetical protein FJ316_13180, partial [SAR202 cluster bacterium]|nr:hypothetical protein [SAR202 cluster bacterium]